MILTLQRSPSAGDTTPGDLSVNGVHECFTCEDQIREIPGQPVERWKVYGKTAIPAGRYRVLVTPSSRFKRDLPLLCDVPGFGGIRIHVGNTSADTDGCILPGTVRVSSGVASSTKAFDSLFPKIQTAIQSGDEVWIEVKNPEGYNGPEGVANA